MNKQYVRYYLSASIALITLAVFLPALWNDFVNWDDNLYVYENPNIRSLDWAFIQWAFTGFYWSNWHPVTWISHAVDYALWGLNPLGHHLTNILLHAVNTFLVVFLCMRLLGIWKERLQSGENPSFLGERGLAIAAGVTGLLFGLHPLHVESVAWVSERKDLLCALFFLLSILSYAHYARMKAAETDSDINTPASAHFKPYLLSVAFFILALMSKPMAVSLPIVLLILDWRPFQRMSSLKAIFNIFLEKLPFIGFSLFSSIMTMKAQQGAISLNEHVPFLARILVAAKAYIAYLGKIIAPLELLPYYPYPTPQTVSLLSPHYLLPILLLSGITLFLIVTAKKWKGLPPAWGYYVVTLLPVIGLVQVGTQSMADRYLYLPSISPFLIIGCGAAWIWSKTVIYPMLKRLVLAAAIVLLLAMSLATQKQIAIWENSIELWSAVIQADPHCDALAYYNRGAALGSAGQYARAIEDFNKVIADNPLANPAYMNRALAFGKLGRFEEAILDYSRVVLFQRDSAQAYIGRGAAYEQMGMTGQALQDYQTACELGSETACGRVGAR